MAHWYWLRDVGNKVPYMEDVLSITENTIQFDGYFYLEDGAMPVERIVWTGEKLLHIEILSKKTGEDTSQYSTMEDEDGSGPYQVCFFPTAVITLTYRILSELVTKEYEDAARERILALEPAVEERNRRCYEERMRHSLESDTESDDEDAAATE